MAPEDTLNTAFRFFTEVGIIDQLITTKLETVLPGRMTATQFGILSHLSRRPDGETPLQLARAFQVPKTSMTHMLAGLVQHGLIDASPNPRDKRSKVARATPAGIAFVPGRMKVLAAELAPVMQDLTIDPFLTALPVLEQIRIALDAERDPPQG